MLFNVLIGYNGLKGYPLYTFNTIEKINVDFTIHGLSTFTLLRLVPPDVRGLIGLSFPAEFTVIDISNIDSFFNWLLSFVSLYNERLIFSYNNQWYSVDSLTIEWIDNNYIVNSYFDSTVLSNYDEIEYLVLQFFNIVEDNQYNNYSDGEFL